MLIFCQLLLHFSAHFLSHDRSSFHFGLVPTLVLEGCSIISDNPFQKTKPCYNIFNKTNDYFVRNTPSGDNFYPFGEVIGGS
jgi:hypothetical protein